MSCQGIIDLPFPDEGVIAKVPEFRERARARSRNRETFANCS